MVRKAALLNWNYENFTSKLLLNTLFIKPCTFIKALARPIKACVKASQLKFHFNQCFMLLIDSTLSPTMHSSPNGDITVCLEQNHSSKNTAYRNPFIAVMTSLVIYPSATNSCLHDTSCERFADLLVTRTQLGRASMRSQHGTNCSFVPQRKENSTTRFAQMAEVNKNLLSSTLFCETV